MAFFMGILISNTSAGINKKPPPAPKKPVTKPIAIPYNNSVKRFTCALEALSSEPASSAVFFIMAIEASNIKTANKTMVANSCVIVTCLFEKSTGGIKGISIFRAMNTVVIEDKPKSSAILMFTQPLR